MHPYAYATAWCLTFGGAQYDDFELINMTNYEAALYFMIMWFVFPFITLINLPLTFLYSPAYLVIILWRIGELFIDISFGGKEINERVDEADEESENDTIEIDE